MEKIDLNTEVEELKKYYNDGNNVYSSFPEIENYLTDHDLTKLMLKHKGEEYIDLIIEKICSQKISLELAESIFDLFEGEYFAMNELVMTGNASVKMLEVMSSSEDRFLAEHSRLALLINEMNEADESDFKSILKKFESSADEFNNAARYHIAVHKRTPPEVLEILMTDSIKHIAEAAESNLKKKLGEL